MDLGSIPRKDRMDHLNWLGLFATMSFSFAQFVIWRRISQGAKNSRPPIEKERERSGPVRISVVVL
jgi:hypothetical protein